MNDERLLQLALGGAAVLFVAGALYLLKPEPVVPARSVPLEPPPTAPTATAAPAEPPPVQASPAPAPLRDQAPPAPPSAPAEEARSPEPPADIRERLKALEPLRRETFAGLADLAGRVEACRLQGAGLSLTLETLEGRVRVLAVRVMSTAAGTGGDSDVEPVPRDDGPARCARGALERTIIAAPSARPGRQWEMSWAPGARP